MKPASLPNLIPLIDGRSGIRATMPVEIRQPSPDPEPSAVNSPSPRGWGRGEGTPQLPPLPPVNSDSPVLDFIFSDETLDRFGEIISADGWRLDNYRRNPVFQNAHQYGDIIFTLGKALITEIRSASTGGSSSREAPSSSVYPSDAVRGSVPSTFLYQRIEFAVDVNPMARIAYGLYRGKFLNAVSVGFIPIRWEDGVAQASSPASSGGVSPPLSRGKAKAGPAVEAQVRAHRSAPCRRRYLEQELLEVSAVGIPANPSALQLGLKAGAIEKSDLRELAELLRQVTTDVPQPSTPVAAPLGAPQPLLQLARTLRELLRGNSTL